MATLKEIRKSRGVTQAELSRRMNTTQSAISRIEHEPGMRLSTLRAYVAALGGKLVIEAHFAGGAVRHRVLGSWFD